MAEPAQREIGPDKSLLLVDDDEPFLRRLAKAMEKRGFEIETASSVAAGRAIATARPPAYAVVDLRLEDGNGLDVVEVLREKRPDSRVVVLTGYGAIATAVAAVSIEVKKGNTTFANGYTTSQYIDTVGYPSEAKNETFECGFPAFGDAREKLDVRFYLVAVLFLIFDLELAFIVPWGINLKASYEITKNFSVSAGMENILDLRYRTYSSGLVAPGRNFILSAKASF